MYKKYLPRKNTYTWFPHSFQQVKNWFDRASISRCYKTFFLHHWYCGLISWPFNYFYCLKYLPWENTYTWFPHSFQQVKTDLTGLPLVDVINLSFFIFDTSLSTILHGIRILGKGKHTNIISPHVSTGKKLIQPGFH